MNSTLTPKAQASVQVPFGKCEAVVAEIWAEADKTKLSRGKLFKLCFERFETTCSNVPLTPEVKASIRDSVDLMLERAAKEVLNNSVVEQVRSRFSVSGDGELEHRKIVTAKSSEVLSIPDELQQVGRLLISAAKAAAKKADGPTEADVRKITRLKNAIRSRLFELRGSTEHAEIFSTYEKVLETYEHTAKLEIAAEAERNA